MDVVIDFETVSKCDLKKAGAWRYSEDPSTDILCLCWKDETGREGMWEPATDFDFHLSHMVGDSSVRFVAHNAGFEKAIWRNIMIPKYGFPDIPNDRWSDTMAVAAVYKLPQEMGDAAKVLGLRFTKDVEGKSHTLSLSRSFRKTGDYDRSEQSLARVYAYCRDDVRAEMEMHLVLRDFPDGERAVWLLDQVINERGVVLDLDFVAHAQAVVDKAIPTLKKEFAELTGGLTPNQRDKFLSWLRWEQGVVIDDMKKETVDAILGAEDEDELVEEREGADSLPVLTPDAERALTLRSLVRSSSVTKLGRMRQCVNRDGRARGLYAYYGAGTGRWAGRLFQPQNLPRGTLKVRPDLVVDVIATEDPAHVNFMLGPPVETVSSALRHCFVPAPGLQFAVGDFAQIEARIVLALARQDTALRSFIDGTPYEDMASKIFGRPITKADVEERTIGKNTVLGCGFGMGWKKFRNRYCKEKPPEFAQEAIEKYRTQFAPLVPVMWRRLNLTMTMLLGGSNPTEYTPYEDGELFGSEFRLDNGNIIVRMPSDRQLFFPTAIFKRNEHTRNDKGEPLYWRFPKGEAPEDFSNEDLMTPEPNSRPVRNDKWGYTQWSTGGRPRSVNMHGGKVAENIVQALARDLLVEAMLKCETEGLPVVMHSHDEIVCETARQDAAVALKQIMEDSPSWAKALGIPVATEVWTGDRYRK